ncbi:MAG: hypothetical protein CFE37_07495 [Alphaproteobacteria bacterium PA4]|nr:MAG: hypothetical protein CFE37_07495 [Alphaproteobacteria bacterium PA4]
MKRFLIGTALLAVVAASPAAAYEFDGIRIEGQGGFDRLQFKQNSNGIAINGNDNGWTYGAEAGFDLRLSPKVILGALGNYNWSSVGRTFANGAGSSIAADSRGTWSAMGRLGVKVTDTTLLYVGAGYASTKVNYLVVPATPGASFNTSERYGGVRGAVGLEQGLGRSLYAKVEYRYTNYKDGMQGHQVIGGLGLRFGQSSPPVTEVAMAPAPPAPAPLPMAAPVLPPCPPAAATPGPFLVFFDFNKSVLSAETATILDRAAEQYLATGQTSVALAGHADTSGSPDYNQALSERRANAVKAYMLGKGVPETAAMASGFGESRPLVQTADGVREPQNRRVELTFGGAPAPVNAGTCTPQ